MRPTLSAIEARIAALEIKAGGSSIYAVGVCTAEPDGRLRLDNGEIVNELPLDGPSLWLQLELVGPGDDEPASAA